MAASRRHLEGHSALLWPPAPHSGGPPGDLLWSRRGLRSAPGDQWGGALCQDAGLWWCGSPPVLVPSLTWPFPAPPASRLFTSGLRLQKFSSTPRSLHVFIKIFMIVYNVYIKKIFVVSKIVFKICIIVMSLSFCYLALTLPVMIKFCLLIWLPGKFLGTCQQKDKILHLHNSCLIWCGQGIYTNFISLFVIIAISIKTFLKEQFSTMEE